jgi:hypothetical protein
MEMEDSMKSEQGTRCNAVRPETVMAPEAPGMEKGVPPPPPPPGETPIVLKLYIIINTITCYYKKIIMHDMLFKGLRVVVDNQYNNWLYRNSLEMDRKRNMNGMRCRAGAPRCG